MIINEAEFEDGCSVVYSDMGPPRFQVATIFYIHMDLKVVMMLKNFKFVHGMGLGTNQ